MTTPIDEILEPTRVCLSTYGNKPFGWLIGTYNGSGVFIMDEQHGDSMREYTPCGSTKQVPLPTQINRNYLFRSHRQVTIQDDQMTNRPEWLSQPYKTDEIRDIPKTDYQVRIHDGHMQYKTSQLDWQNIEGGMNEDTNGDLYRPTHRSRLDDFSGTRMGDTVQRYGNGVQYAIATGRYANQEPGFITVDATRAEPILRANLAGSIQENRPAGNFSGRRVDNGLTGGGRPRVARTD